MRQLTLLLTIISMLVIADVGASPKDFALHQAVLDQDIQLVRTLLSRGAAVDVIGSRKYGYGSALHVAVREGNLDIAKLLLDRGAQVDVLDPNDFTPLHNAAWNGNVEMTELLLAAGADIEASTYDGDTPLTLAQNNDQPKTAEYIQARIQAPSATRTKVESPEIADSRVIDISGTYIAETTAWGSGMAHRRIRNIQKLNGELIVLKQTGNTITGSIDSKSSWIIRGTREGNTINFYIVAGNEIVGNWEINADATKLEGAWFTNGAGGAQGKWDLTKIPDVSGTYISKVTGQFVGKLGLVGANPEVKLVQEGSKLTGTFEPDGKLWGDVNGDSIELDYFSQGYHGKVKWKVEPGSNALVGTWAYKETVGKDGNWNLTKIGASD